MVILGDKRNYLIGTHLSRAPINQLRRIYKLKKESKKRSELNERDYHVQYLRTKRKELKELKQKCKHLDDLDKIGSFFYTKLEDGTFSLGTMDINEPMVGVRFCPFCGDKLK